MTINELANWVCSTIPEGWDLEFSMENGYAGIKLYNDEGKAYEFDNSENTIEEQINLAVQHAIKYNNQSTESQ